MTLLGPTSSGANLMLSVHNYSIESLGDLKIMVDGRKLDCESLSFYTAHSGRLIGEEGLGT
jgi:hypothetical protein